MIEKTNKVVVHYVDERVVIQFGDRRVTVSDEQYDSITEELIDGMRDEPYHPATECRFKALSSYLDQWGVYNEHVCLPDVQAYLGALRKLKSVKERWGHLRKVLGL